MRVLLLAAALCACAQPVVPDLDPAGNPYGPWRPTASSWQGKGSDYHTESGHCRQTLPGPKVAVEYIQCRTAREWGNSVP